jgi:hypothetical protein
VKPAAVLACALMLSGCAGGSPAPEWETRAYGAVEKFKQQYLEGNVRRAQRYFTEAKAAAGATGKPELVARVELVRCALGTAALDVEACTGFEALRDGATKDDQAYGIFLSGSMQELKTSRLPSQYRGVATAPDAAARNQAMQKISDPVSRLIAAGALFRGAQLSNDGLNSAIDTASMQGYRRPLLAYLNVQAKKAESSGDAAALQSIRQRIELVLRSLSP